MALTFAGSLQPIGSSPQGALPGSIAAPLPVLRLIPGGSQAAVAPAAYGSDTLVTGQPEGTPAVAYPAKLKVDHAAANWLGPKFRGALSHINPRTWFKSLPLIPAKVPNTTLNQAEFLQDRQVFDTIYKLIDGAQKSIQLETFIIHNDETSRTIAYKLAQKAAQGVDVKFLYDPNGSGGSAEVIKYLKQYGVQVLPSVKKEIIPGDIDHRKTLMVDGMYAMTGGMNIGDEYALRWHDVMVKIHGPAVAEMQHKYFEVWRSAGGQGDETPFLAPPGALETAGIPTKLFSSAPGDPSYKNVLFDAIANAKRSIQIEVPYWGDPTFINQVIAARQRGVQVTVVVPNTSDTWGKLDYPTRPFLQTLIDNGIEVYHYQVDDKKNNYAHGKVIVIDDHWVSVGSGNLDFRSFYDNYELNLAFDDPEFARTIQQRLFIPDMQNSIHLTEAPKVGPLVKALDWLFLKFYHMV